MLLDNYAATLYPQQKITTTNGKTINDISFTDAIISSTSPDDYSESEGREYANMYRRGIAFGSGTTPPP